MKSNDVAAIEEMLSEETKHTMEDPQKEISEYFGGRDRTTILYSVETVAKDAANDSSLKKTIDKIIKNVQEQ